jgi:hypothetical protein
VTRPVVASAEMVGPYRVVRPIGGGGSARIDLARIERAYGFEREVVLKRPLEHLRSSPAVATSLRREASLGGRLRHPNVVAVLDAGEHDGYDYLVLEYIRGMSLRAAIEAAPGEVARLPLDAVLSIVVGIATGLHFAHELAGADGLPLGLVHRDVSPANVLLGLDGTVKLADFGIAKDTHVDTLSGSLRGTVTYMAPEQCRGHAFDRRADVFSLGVILYELITGRRLFWADNDVASLHRVLSGAIVDPRTLVPSIDPELAAIAMRALAHDASDRIPTAKHLAETLEAFATRRGVLIGARRIERALAGRSVASSPVRPSISAAVTAPRGFADVIPTKPMASFRVAMPAPEDEPSLVAVIQQTPDPDEVRFAPPPLADIPPLESAAAPAVDGRVPLSAMAPASFTASQARAMPVTVEAPRRRRIAAIVVSASLVIGVVLAIVVLRSPSSTESDIPRVTAPPPAAPAVEPPTAPAPEPPARAPVAEPEHELTDQKPSSEPTAPPAPVREPVRARPRVGSRSPPPKPPTTPVAPAGSGSAAPDRTKVKWNDKIVLPSDSGSQTGSNR